MCLAASVVTLATRLHVQLEMLHLQGHLVQLVLAPEALSAEYPVSMQMSMYQTT